MAHETPDLIDMLKLFAPIDSSILTGENPPLPRFWFLPQWYAPYKTDQGKVIGRIGWFRKIIQIQWPIQWCGALDHFWPDWVVRIRKPIVIYDTWNPEDMPF